ncbi:MAG: response regulator [Deltaproteobacteria bacterium]|nr:response regulator [Deltaproteobacteria bacterium]
MKNKRILLIEDDPDDVALTLRAFKKNNIEGEIITINEGAEALDYLFARGKFEGRDKKALPQLVLLDLKLPRLDGKAVLKAMRSEIKTMLPVVVLTSSDEEQDVKDSYRLGANSYIRKPVDFTRFMDVIRDLGIYWLDLNEAPKEYA